MKKLKTSKLLILAVLAMTFMNCGDKTDDLPPIGGYNKADDVAASNLVAYWAFNGNGQEAKSSAVPSNSVNSSFVTGKKGQGLSLNRGYLLYNEIAALKNLPSYSVSAWINVSNNKNTINASSPIFSLTRAGEWAGNINLMCETAWFDSASDTLVVKGLNVSKVGVDDSWQDTRNEPSNGGAQAFKGAGKWIQAILVWDAITSKFKVYGDGVKISNPDWELRLHAGNQIGALVFSLPTRPLIGAWGPNAGLGGLEEPWQVPLTGKIDELRIFNKALTDAEIDALYKLENAGR
ncbi:MAG: LamG domain-containing protein [Bacteroidota bacterium]|nr:LamG domain-containing protein [Bacteroidota bacterium]